MLHRALLLRCVLALLLAPSLAGGTQDDRLASVESILDHFYRGETPEAGHRRVGAMVDAFNAQVQRRNADLDAARAQADRAVAPSRDLAAALEAEDKALGPVPDGSDREGMKRYNDRVAARNALADRYNEALAAARAAVDVFNARAAELDAGLAQARAGLKAAQDGLKARQEAFEAFRRQDGDVAFFTALNRMLAELRAAGPGPERDAALAKVRGYRRELAGWAMAHQAAQEHGLVLVDALVGDEPCCFIVDTGAQVVCLPGELIEALGLSGSLGPEGTMVLAGGQKLRGRSIKLPQVAVGGMAGRDVAGSAVPPSEVGIDGLLGQSFLKRFVYTIDEDRPGKLILVPRP